MPSDESKGSQLDAIGSLAQRQLDNTVVGAVLQGVEFTNLPEALRQQLRDLFISGAFDLAPGSGQACGVRSNPFQELLEELQPALNQLAAKVSPS